MIHTMAENNIPVKANEDKDDNSNAVNELSDMDGASFAQLEESDFRRKLSQVNYLESLLLI